MMNNQELKLTSLSLRELKAINGGTILGDLGEWCGRKVGKAMKFLGALDWSGSFIY